MRVRRGMRAALAAAVLVMGTAVMASATGAQGVATAAGVTPSVLATSACTVSGPLMGLAPYPGVRLDGFPPFVTLSATNGRGTYAGVSFTDTSEGLSFTVVRRQSTGAVTVLGRFVYFGHSTDFVRAVRVVGFDPWGGVVVLVQRTNYNIEDERFIGIRYDAAGVRHDLTSDPSWLAVEPLAVADSGSVVGTVTGPDRLRKVVIWRGPGSGVMTRLSQSGRVATAFTANADWYDDVQSGYSSAAVHPHGGAPARRLAALDGQIASNAPRLQGTSYDSAWGTDNDATAVTIGTASYQGVSAKWGHGSTGSTGPVPATRALPFFGIAGVGRFGDAVGVTDPTSGGHLNRPLVLATRTGKLYAMPAVYSPEFTDGFPVVIDPYGQVVLTAAARLPVLVTCPL